MTIRRDLTADFVYIRLHGAEELYVRGYSDKTLKRWANRIEHWRKGKQPRDAKLITRPRRAAKRLDLTLLEVANAATR